jgi:hypothetical protein
MKNQTYTQKLASVCFRTRHGDATRVAEKTGFSVAFVSEVLRGNFVNEKIMDAAYDLCKDRTKNLDIINKMKAVKGVKDKFFTLEAIAVQN